MIHCCMMKLYGIFQLQRCTDNAACRSFQWVFTQTFSAAFDYNYARLSSFSKFPPRHCLNHPCKNVKYFCMLKKKKFLFILSGVFFHVGVSWRSWQRPASKHTDRLPGRFQRRKTETSRKAVGICFSGHSRWPYWTALYWAVSFRLCSVMCCFIPFYLMPYSWWFWKSASVELRNEAHCHSIQWPNAKGSRVLHCSPFSLCVPGSPPLQWLWSLLSLSTLSRLAENRDGGLGGLLGCRNVTCIDGL